MLCFGWMFNVLLLCRGRLSELVRSVLVGVDGCHKDVIGANVWEVTSSQRFLLLLFQKSFRATVVRF